ncbi:probable protein phosphatase 2C 76 [Tanacetum coccineum]
MYCGSHFKTLILQAGNIQKVSQGLSQFASFRRSLKTTSATRFPSYQLFPSIRKMMVDTEATANRGLTNTPLTEKEDDGGYASGEKEEEDGKLSCGYSSFRGKRASMEDFYDVKTCEINGQTVCLFGIFDGQARLIKRLTSEFLESGKDTFRDDGSTASTAVLVGNHLYVANVGDSRTVISKAGKGTWRVGGVLAMSRAFGNRMLKQFVVAEPEIQEQELDEEFELLVLASDGLWDVVPNECDKYHLQCSGGRYTQSATKLEPQIQSETDMEVQMPTEAETETEPETETDAQPLTEPECKTEPESTTEPETNSESETETETKSAQFLIVVSSSCGPRSERRNTAVEMLIIPHSQENFVGRDFSGRGNKV